MSASNSTEVPREEIVALLQKADGYLSLIGYRYRGDVPAEIATECVAVSTECRTMAERLGGDTTDDIIRGVEERRNDPEFMDRIRRLTESSKDVLDLLKEGGD